MSEGLFTMSAQEIERITIIKRVAEKGGITQSDAMRLLTLSKRQIIRLVKLYRHEGSKGLLSRHRGKESNRKYDVKKKAIIRELVETHYRDFGPTFAAEKLKEKHKIGVSKETLRKWMVEWGLWKAKREKQAQIHQQRARRAHVGELIQIDGSPHDWFEGRSPKCCLLVFIDDATSRLMAMRFEESETSEGYFRLTREYIERYGIPLTLYSDKYGVFRVNLPDAKGDGETQFGRVCRTLGIELLCAHSPQAKGRVERANNTLQDRLVKEMCLAGVDNIEAGNEFLSTYINDHNSRFAVQPMSDLDVHRQLLLSQEALDLIFSFQDERKLSKNLELNYKKVIYQIKTRTKGYRLRGAKVTICESLNGTITVLHQGKILPYSSCQKSSKVALVLDSKQVLQHLDKNIKADGRTQGHKPKTNHPWRQYDSTKKKTSPAEINHSQQKERADLTNHPRP